jgi:cytochrome b6-f complex iron-sulfur subunit
MRDCQCDRRGFLTASGAAIAGLALARSTPARGQETHRVAIPLDKVPPIKNVGGSVVIKVKDKPLLLVRDTPGEVRAFDPICSHKQCVVQYQSAAHNLNCPCHSSQFSLDGKVSRGPAKQALTVYPAAIEGDRIVVTL